MADDTTNGSNQPTPACRICGNAAGNTLYQAREMMYGTREPFTYFECSSCGCVQIREIPPNLGDYYPPDYPFFGIPKHFSALKRRLRADWARHNLFKPVLIGSLLTRLYGQAEFFDWIRRAGVTFESRILDVGSGRGKRLMEMNSAGFKNVSGIDPFIERDLVHPGGVRIVKAEVTQAQGQYDLVMSHHSFEHVPDPLPFLRELHRLLAPGGVALVRIPIAGCYAWRHYRTDWMALDAPRHLHLHTTESMRIVADQAGLVVDDTVWDSQGFTLWASEQYRLDIPLLDPRSHWVNPAASPFTPDEIRAFDQKADQLNAEGQGDAAAFYLRRKEDVRSGAPAVRGGAARRKP